MRILHVSSMVEFGGGEKHLLDLCRGLSARGHQIFLALRPTNKWQERADFLPAERILHVSIRNSFGVLSAKRIGDFAREHEIDIVHAHVARDYIPASIACVVSKRSRFVLTRHVMFPLKPFNRFALKNLSRAIGVSPAVGIELERLFSRDKVTVVPNGIEIVDLGSEHRKEMRSNFREFHGIPPQAFLIGTVGQLIPLKGQRDLVLAAAEVIKHAPGVKFLIVGNDPSPGRKFRRELKRLVNVMGIGENFLWLDWAEDMPSMLAALDVYVSPSHSESFGIALLEAMAAGVPLVATRTDGSLELVNDADMLVPFSDPVALAAAIIDLINHEERLRNRAQILQHRARENYSLDRMVTATENIYREIVGT